MKANIRVAHAVDRSPRVMQVESLFDIPPSQQSEQTWSVNLPIEDRDWHVGLIVGPSGAGKTSIARQLFAEQAEQEAARKWSPTAAIIDEFPDQMATQDVTALFSSVGLGSVPAWVRPFHTLSTGEQFRANVARTLAEQPDLAVVDEWTSTVDRQVGKIASACAAKAVRKRRQRLIALTCHYDVEDWLQPDWVYQPHVDEFTWRSVQPRPQVRLDIHQTDRDAWRLFRKHHYLSAKLPYGPDGRAWCAFVDDNPIAFFWVTGFPHYSPGAQRIRRARRAVVLPDWQGIGVGMAMADYLAERYTADGYRMRSVTAHPGIVRYKMRSPRWHLEHKHVLATGKNGTMKKPNARLRMLSTYTFEYKAAR